MFHKLYDDFIYAFDGELTFVYAPRIVKIRYYSTDAVWGLSLHKMHGWSL